MSGSLWVALLGVVLSCLSLGWQAATYVLTGGRVKVTLEVGALGNGGLMATGSPDKARPAWFQQLAAQGFTTPVVVVKVANVGRQPVTVARWNVSVPRKVSMTAVQPVVGPSLPHRLEVGESASWAVELASVQAFAATTSKVLAHGRRVSVVGEVELGDGRKKRSAGKLH